MPAAELPERKPKVVHDTIYGTITLSSLEDLLINSTPVFRLNSIHQMSLAYMSYPNATHSRLTHSLGVLHISSNLLVNSIENALEEHAREFVEKAAELVNYTHSRLRSKFMETRIEDVMDEIINSIEKHLPSESPPVGIVDTQKNESLLPRIRGVLEEKVNHILSIETLAAHLTRDKVIRAFYCKARDLSSKDSIAAAFSILYQAFRIAALCHDLGHYPFSHVLERALEEFENHICNLEESTLPNFMRKLQFIYRNKSDALRIEGKGRLHEVATLFSIRELFTSSSLVRLTYERFERDLEITLRNTDLEDLKETIRIFIKDNNYVNEIIKNIDETLRRLYLEFLLGLLGELTRGVLSGRLIGDERADRVLEPLSNLISGGEIDADRIDYIMRDGLFTGIGSSSSEISRVISLFTLMKDGDNFVFAPSIRSLGGVEALLLDRMRIYKYVQLHHRVLLSERLLEKIVVKLLLEGLRKLSGELSGEVGGQLNHSDDGEEKKDQDYCEKTNLAEIAKQAAHIILRNSNKYPILLLLYPSLYMLATQKGDQLRLGVLDVLNGLDDYWLISLIRDEYRRRRWGEHKADSELNRLIEIFLRNGVGLKSLWKRDAGYHEMMRQILFHLKGGIGYDLKLLLWVSSVFGSNEIRRLAEHRLSILNHLESLRKLLQEGHDPEESFLGGGEPEDIAGEVLKVYLWVTNTFLFRRIHEKSNIALMLDLDKELSKNHEGDLLIAASIFDKLLRLRLKYNKLRFIEISRGQKPQARILNSSEHLAPIEIALRSKIDLSFPFNIYYPAGREREFPRFFTEIYREFLLNHIKLAIAKVIIQRKIGVILCLAEDSYEEAALRSAVRDFIKERNWEGVLLICVKDDGVVAHKIVKERGEHDNEMITVTLEEVSASKLRDRLKNINLQNTTDKSIKESCRGGAYIIRPRLGDEPDGEVDKLYRLMRLLYDSRL